MPEPFGNHPRGAELRQALTDALKYRERGEDKSLSYIPELSLSDASLVRAIVCDRAYRQVLTGEDRKTFVAFPETQLKQPEAYKKLIKLGYVAIEPKIQV